MEQLLENLNKNYKNLRITSIENLKEKTINSIYFLDNKYILKIYNVDEEKQILASIKAQKIIHDNLGFAPDIILNNKGNLVSKFNEQLYCIQEYIKSEKSETDIVRNVASELYMIHNELKKLNKNEYKFEKKDKTYEEIKKEVLYNLEISNKQNIDKEVSKQLEVLLNRRLKYLEKYHSEYKPQIYQIIHGDVRLTNILTNNNKAYFIDFDFISNGDLLFEIGSAVMLISNYDLNKANKFLQIYNSLSETENYDKKLIFNNLMSYYVQSSFPIKLIGKIDNKALKEMMNGRIKCLDFCDNFLESERY